MNIIQSVELFTAINLASIGLSHFFQPKIWVDFFAFLHERKNIGNIFNALISLGMGSFILAFHFVWQWPRVIVTLYGLSQVLKGFIYLVYPSVGIASIGKVNQKNANKFKWVGLPFFMIALVIISGLIHEGAFNQ